MKRLAGASTLRGRVTNLRAVEDGVGGRLTTLVATLAGTAGRQQRQKYRCGAPRPPPRPFAAGRLRERGAVAGGGDGPGCGGHPVKQPDARGRPKCGGGGGQSHGHRASRAGTPVCPFFPTGGYRRTGETALPRPRGVVGSAAARCVRRCGPSPHVEKGGGRHPRISKPSWAVTWPSQTPPLGHHSQRVGGGPPHQTRFPPPGLALRQLWPLSRHERADKRPAQCRALEA